MSNPHGLVGSLSAVPLLTAALVAPAAALVTERVSLGALGARGNHRSEYPSFSADGRYVVFYSSASNLVSGDTNGFQDIFVRDRCGPATSATFSGDGINADTIAPASAVLGSSWSAPLTIGHPHGTGGPLVLKVRRSTFNGPNFPSPTRPARDRQRPWSRSHSPGGSAGGQTHTHSNGGRRMRDVLTFLWPATREECCLTWP